MREVMEGACVTTKNSEDELASTGDLPLAAGPGTTAFQRLPEHDF